MESSLSSATSHPIALARNAPDGPRARYPFRDLLTAEMAAEIRLFAAGCPRYQPTPLIDLPEVARECGVARVSYKDEGGRFGLGSFKALGGVYAVGRRLAERIGRDLGRSVDVAEVASGNHRAAVAQVTVVAATDGNHGRAVAAGARHFGCRSRIYLHEGVSAGREEAIRSYGAEIVRTAGDYDDSVRAAAADAQREGWELISDTSTPDDDASAREVLRGYTVLGVEIVEALGDDPANWPTHLFVQAGVGGLAAALTAYFWSRMGPHRPRVVVVEPDRADCLYQSAIRGNMAVASGDLATVMAGLSCGEPSALAWRVLQAGASDFVTIPDAPAIDGMRLLARRGIVAGESATAGLAALRLAADAGVDLGLTSQSHVLLIGTEGATDPELYRQLVEEAQ